MIAYRIEVDFSIQRVEGTIDEILHEGQVWACVDYDDENDVWCDDEGLLQDAVVLAWVGRARRVPLPALIMGADGEDSIDPRMQIDEVRYGVEFFVSDDRPKPRSPDELGPN